MKNSKLTSSILALGIVAILGVGSAVAAQGGHGDHNMGAGNMALTPEQQTQAQTIYADHRKAVGPLMEQMQAKRAELKVLSLDKKADPAKVQALYREIADLKAKMFTAKATLRNTLDEKGLNTGGHGMGGMGGMGGGMSGCPMMGGDHMGGKGMKGGHGMGERSNAHNGSQSMGAGHGAHN